MKGSGKVKLKTPGLRYKLAYEKLYLEDKPRRQPRRLGARQVTGRRSRPQITSVRWRISSVVRF